MWDTKSKPTPCNVPDIKKQEEPESSNLSDFVVVRQAARKLCDLKVKKQDENLEFQSGVVEHAHDANTQKHQVLQFTDQNPSYVQETDAILDSTRNATDDPGTDFADFFARPVEIQSITWSVGGKLDTKMNPWLLWKNNKRVENRLANFRNFRGKLHVKVVINGNGFYWGSAMVSYYPELANPFLPSTAPFYYTDAAYTGDLMQASQRPKIFLDPTTSQGGELQLPLFMFSDALDITIDGPWRDMGELWYVSLVDLQHANNTQPISITTYAWASDVVLTSPTHVNPAGLAPQAGEVDEHAGDGPVSKPAALVEKIAGKLTNVPLIGPYALAAQKASGAAAAVARAFGYSRPRIVDDPCIMKVMQGGDMATTDAGDTSASLALQAKSEVSIDPRLVGLGETDELAFRNIYQKESYIGTIPWTVDATRKSVIGSVAVSPMMVVADSRVVPATEAGLTFAACGAVALPFYYWRGIMRYRLQIVASAYHKGRILVVWDPVSAQANPESNVVRSHVIDIAEEKDFSIDVGWGVPTAALEVGSMPGANSLKSGTLAIPDAQRDNGILSFYVLNTLTYTGTSTAPVQINVYASAVDLDVWGPTNRLIKDYSFFPVPDGLLGQAGVVGSDEYTTPAMNAPESENIIDKMGGDTPMTSYSTFTHGDQVDSFRTLLKRYTYLKTSMFAGSGTPTGAWRSQYKEYAGYPIFRGPQLNPIHSGGNNIPTDGLSYIAAAFRLYRGAIRWKMIPTFGGPDLASITTVCRWPDASYADGTIENYAFNNTNQGAVTNTRSIDAGAGLLATTSNMSNVLEFQAPWYSRVRAVPASKDLAWIADSTGFRVHVTCQDNVNVGIDEYWAIGEDFNLFFWVGLPTMYLYAP